MTQDKEKNLEKRYLFLIPTALGALYLNITFLFIFYTKINRICIDYNRKSFSDTAPQLELYLLIDLSFLSFMVA